MKAENRRKRIFGAGILLMMSALVLFTMAAVATEGEDNSSYSLVIIKEFDDKTPEDVRKAAEEKEYQFTIVGTRRDGDQLIPVNEIITLPRIDAGNKIWTSEKLTSSGPFHVTVTEITDNIVLQVDGEQLFKSEAKRS